jgi:hypothetical protein
LWRPKASQDAQVDLLARRQLLGEQRGQQMLMLLKGGREHRPRPELPIHRRDRSSSSGWAGGACADARSTTQSLSVVPGKRAATATPS